MDVDRRESTRRFYVFMLLGPILALGGAASLDIVAGRCPRYDEGFVMALLFGGVVSAVARTMDELFALAFPIPVRAPLTAIVGAAVAVGLLLAIIRKMLPVETLMPFAILGAICMGVCSVLSDDFRS
jgi:hypothetical protein